MITNITLENFKCFRQVSINPKRLTVLIGPNGTGKSSILQALLLLKQSVGEQKIKCQGDSVNFGDPSELVPSFLTKEPVVRLAFEGTENGSSFGCNARLSALLEPMPQSILPPSFSANAVPLKKLQFVQAARGFVRPSYSLRIESSEEISLDVGLSDLEEQLATNLVYSAPMERLSALVEKVTGTGLSTKMVPGRKVEIKSLASTGAVNIVAEGFGTNALVQVLMQLVTAMKGATVLIEEPEIHLHPKAQADLAEVLADTAKAEDKQIIMTTHSEYVAGRLLTLVAEGKLTTDELAIYAFEKDEKGECSATEIEVTERGQVKGGLTGFHEAARDEMRRYADGLRNRA